MTRTLLVSGGAGFIGTELAVNAVARGVKVVVLDALHPQVHPGRTFPERLRLLDGVELLHADATSVASWEMALARAPGHFDVVHLAAETGTGQSLTHAVRHASVNVVGTAALTDALSRTGRRPAQIVLSSSRAVYGEGEWIDEEGRRFVAGQRRIEDLSAGRWAPLHGRSVGVRPVPQEAGRTPPGPTNIYAATKLAQEHLLGAWCSAMEVPLTVLRLQNVYGAGQALSNSYTGVLTFFATLVRSGRVIPVYEGGDILRDFVHVRDVVSAVLAALERTTGRSHTFDVGSGRPRTLLEVAGLLAELGGGPAPVPVDEFRAGDVRAASASIDAAAEALAYAPSVDLRDGLRELLAYASPA